MTAPTDSTLSLKWQIFRICNYIALLISVCYLGIMIYGFFSGTDYMPTRVFAVLVMLLIGVIPTINFASNIYLLEKCYPDRAIGRNHLSLISVVLFFQSLLLCFLTIAFVAFIFDFVKAFDSEEPFLTESLILLLFYGTVLLMTYWITWLQVALRNTIQRNHNRVYGSFLE